MLRVCLGALGRACKCLSQLRLREHDHQSLVASDMISTFQTPTFDFLICDLFPKSPYSFLELQSRSSGLSSILPLGGPYKSLFVSQFLRPASLFSHFAFFSDFLPSYLSSPYTIILRFHSCTAPSHTHSLILPRQRHMQKQSWSHVSHSSHLFSSVFNYRFIFAKQASL